MILIPAFSYYLSLIVCRSLLPVAHYFLLPMNLNNLTPEEIQQLHHLAQRLQLPGNPALGPADPVNPSSIDPIYPQGPGQPPQAHGGKSNQRHVMDFELIILSPQHQVTIPL